MRVAVVAPSRQLLGGAEHYVHVLLPALLAAGHDVCLVYELDDPHVAERLDADIPDLTTHHANPDDPGGARAWLAAWAPDVVYCQGFYAPELEARVLAAFPCVLFAHGYYGTCATGEKRMQRPALTVCDRRFGPSCLVLNAVRGCGLRSPGRVLASYRLQARRLAALPSYRSVLVSSRRLRTEYLRHGLPDDRVTLLPLPCTGTPALESPPVAQDSSGRVLFVGRLTALKGCDYLIEALPMAARALGRALTLTVAGDGPEAPRLKTLAARRGVPAEFLGWIGRDAVSALYPRADLLAVPSVWPEPFGLVGVEAAGSGLPSVGYAVGGIPDWLRAGVTGELAPGDPPTPAGLAEAIARALADSRHHAALRAGAWAAAREYGLARHTERLAERLAAAARGG